MKKKISKQCPNCQSRINRKNDLSRCNSCFLLMCGCCSIGGLCIDCSVDAKSEDTCSSLVELDFKDEKRFPDAI